MIDFPDRCPACGGIGYKDGHICLGHDKHETFGKLKAWRDKFLREELAYLCHQQWSGWMQYLFSQSTINKDGTATIPSWAVERWQRQMKSPYGILTEDEKNSDRAEADRILEVIEIAR